MKPYQACFLLAVLVNCSFVGGGVRGGEVLFIAEFPGEFISVRNH